MAVFGGSAFWEFWICFAKKKLHADTVSCSCRYSVVCLVFKEL